LALSLSVSTIFSSFNFSFMLWLCFSYGTFSSSFLCSSQYNENTMLLYAGSVPTNFGAKIIASYFGACFSSFLPFFQCLYHKKMKPLILPPFLLLFFYPSNSSFFTQLENNFITSYFGCFSHLSIIHF